MDLSTLPILHQETIRDDYLDVMGHMNVRWYITIFDDASWQFFASFGMDESYFQRQNCGAFALWQCIHYLAEICAGEQVSVHGRLLGYSEKRFHFMLFMFNETSGKVAATMEVLGAHVDLAKRRMTPVPSYITTQMDALLAEHEQLNWEAPVIGVLNP
jgi:acyl-CoA thioester hydrolase